MEENSKETTDFDCELLKKIYKSNYGIKYPKNILSCLKLMNVYDHTEICPHYCPAGKIIKISSVPTGISSIWVAISSRVLPITGEALYILKKNSKILKNDFPLIGFMGKRFTSLDIAMFKIDNLCIHYISQELQIGVIIYFKHWEKCSVRLVEIPSKGIALPGKHEENTNNENSEKIKTDEISSFLNENPDKFPGKPETKNFTQNSGFFECPNVNEPKILKEDQFPLNSKDGKSSESATSANSISGTWGSTPEEIGVNSYKNFGFVMDSPPEVAGTCSAILLHSDTKYSGTEIASDSGSKINPDSETKIESNFGSSAVPFFGTNTKNSKIRSQRKCQKAEIVTKVETYLETQVPRKFLFRSQSMRETRRSELKFEPESESGSQICFANSTLVGDTISSDVPRYENIFSSEKLTTMTKIETLMQKVPDWPVNNNQTISSNGSGISNVELYLGTSTTPSYENIQENSENNSREFLTKIFTFLFWHFDFFIIILLCFLLFFILFVIMNHK